MTATFPVMPGQEKRAAHEIVAEVQGISVRTVKDDYRRDVARVEAAMRAEPDPERKAEKGRRLAKQIQRTRQYDKELRASRSKGVWAYLDLERQIDKARLALAKALTIARGSSIEPEHVEVLTADSLNKSKALLNLINLVIVGNADVDWDGELARMERS